MGLGILSVLTPLPAAPPGGLCLRLQVLGRCLAAVAAAHAWLTGRAGRYLAAWALPQFLLLTQGDLQVRGHRGHGGTHSGAGFTPPAPLQVLKAEAEQLMLQVSGTFPEPEEIQRDSSPEPLPSPGSPWELQLCRQIRDMANSIQVWWDCGRGVLSMRIPVSPCVPQCHLMFLVSQLFSGDVLWMFSTSCKRLSAEIFDQTMPLGRHWRLRPRAGGCQGWGDVGCLVGF